MVLPLVARREPLGCLVSSVRPQLARWLGVTQGQLSRIENCRNRGPRPGSVDSGLGSRSCPPRQSWAYKPPAAVRPKLRDNPAIELRYRPIP
jgi:hypothetical protein